MNITRIADLLGFRLVGNVYLKDMPASGFQLSLVLASQNQGMPLALFPTIRIAVDQPLAPSLKKEISQSITKNIFKNRIPWFGIGPIIEFYLNGFNSKMTNAILDTIDKLLIELQKRNIGPQKVCPVCGLSIAEGQIEQRPTNYFGYSNLVMKVHHDCLEKSRQAEIDSIKASELDVHNTPKSFFISLGLSVAGVFGVLVGLIIFQAWLGILFFLIPYLGVMGWKLGKAPFNMKATAIIIAETLLLVGGLLVWLIWSLAEVNSISFAQAVTASMSDILFSGAMTLLGIGVNYRVLFKGTNEARLKDLNRK